MCSVRPTERANTYSGYSGAHTIYQMNVFVIADKIPNRKWVEARSGQYSCLLFYFDSFFPSPSLPPPPLLLSSTDTLVCSRFHFFWSFFSAVSLAGKITRDVLRATTNACIQAVCIVNGWMAAAVYEPVLLLLASIAQDVCRKAKLLFPAFVCVCRVACAVSACASESNVYQASG